MSTEVTGPNRSFKSTNDLSAKQYFIVKLSSGNVVLASAATDVLLGVLKNKPKASENADVQLVNSQGTCKVKAGGSITAGNMITSDSAGKAVATTTTGNYILGMALEDAATDDVFEFMPMGHARYAATS